MYQAAPATTSREGTRQGSQSWYCSEPILLPHGNINLAYADGVSHRAMLHMRRRGMEAKGEDRLDDTEQGRFCSQQGLTGAV